MYDNVIVTDYDGCCAYWEHGFDMWMISNGYKVLKTGSYDIEDRYGITKEKADDLILAFNESAALKRLAPYKDAIKYIRKLHEDHGYVFHCISAIPNTHDMHEARMENIHNLFGKTAFERLTLCGNSSNKRALLAEYKDTECFWIEDVAENSLMGLDFGMKCVLFDHHYNKDFYHDGVMRVNSWKQIYEQITGEFYHTPGW